MIQYPALLIAFLKMVLKSYKVFRGDGNKWGKAGKAPFHFTANPESAACPTGCCRSLGLSFLTTQVTFTRSYLCWQKLVFSMPNLKSWQPFPSGIYLITVKQGTYSSWCGEQDMRQVQCCGEPFPKPPLSRLDPAASLASLEPCSEVTSLFLKAGISSIGYFIIVIRTSLHFLQTGITQTSRCSPQNNPCPVSAPPRCWCGERTLGTRTVLCSPHRPLLTVCIPFSPFLGGGRTMWEEVWVFGLVWAFFSVVVLNKFTTNIQRKTREYVLD